MQGNHWWKCCRLLILYGSSFSHDGTDCSVGFFVNLDFVVLLVLLSIMFLTP